jgi:uncharacterized coiled-coil protein SlyX
MQNRLISLMICLMTSFPLLSQTLSSDSTIVVPKQAVKNALIMKSQFDTCSMVLKITEEKVVLLEDKTKKQEQLILNLNDVIINKDTIISQNENIIILKDEEISVLKKQKRQKFWNGVLTGVVTGVSVVAVLVLL